MIIKTPRIIASIGLASSISVTLFVGRASAQSEPATPADPPATPAPVTEPAPVAAPASAPVEIPAPAPSAYDAPPLGADMPPAAPPKPKPPLYSLPFQLRGVIPANVVRSDSSLGLYKVPATGASGTAVVSTLIVAHKITDDFAPLIRVGMVTNSPPPGTPDGTNLMNPVVGGLYGIKLSPALRLGLFLGLTIPIGGGGGDTPGKGGAAANARGIATRNAFDNAMFAINDFTVFPGVDLAFMSHGFTAQIEATVFQLTRVRGDAVQKDSSRTNFTAGVHLGYFLIPQFSIGGELRHQRWLSTPAAVEADKTDTLRDTTTFAVGPRFHFKIGDKSWIRPAVSFSMPLDKPLSDQKYKVFQLDLPFVF
jgi:hypothetical protein